MTESNYENQFLSNDETCKELSKKYQKEWSLNIKILNSIKYK